MDIRKVKVDHLALLACLPYTLSLVSILEVKVPEICAECFGNVYFTKFSQYELGKIFGIQLKQCLMWAQVNSFTFC